jgi:hypothetical protein
LRGARADAAIVSILALRRKYEDNEFNISISGTTESEEENRKKPKPEEQEGMPQHHHCPHA